MKTTLISAIAILILSCSNELTIIEDSGCECEIKQTEVRYDPYENVTRVTHHYVENRYNRL